MQVYTKTADVFFAMKRAHTLTPGCYYGITRCTSVDGSSTFSSSECFFFFSKGNMDTNMWMRSWEEEKTRPFPTGLSADVSLFVFNVRGEKGRPSHDTFFCGAFTLFGIPIRSSVCHLIVSSLCKEKSTRLLRTEVSDNVPEYSGPFFVVVLINSFLFFQSSVDFYWWFEGKLDVLSGVLQVLHAIVCVSLRLPLGL